MYSNICSRHLEIHISCYYSCIQGYWFVILIGVYFRRLKLNDDSHEFILESGTVANNAVEKSLVHVQYDQGHCRDYTDVDSGLLYVQGAVYAGYTGIVHNNSLRTVKGDPMRK